MEIDAISNSLASNSTQGLDQQSLGLNKNSARILDLSQEHTNGRMFEQAVQNANKAGETKASTSDNVKLSNSKIDANADAKNENPLILNQKEARSLKEYIESDKPEEDDSGETVLKLALKTLEINYITLSQISKDTLLVKGSAIDMLLATDLGIEDQNLKTNAAEIKIGASSNVSEWQIKRQKVQEIAQETYHDIAHIEVDEGNVFHASVVQGLDEAGFGKEVVSLIFDKPVYFIENE